MKVVSTKMSKSTQNRLGIWLGATIGLPVVLYLVGFVVKSLQNPLVLMLGLLVGFFVPRLWLGRRKSGRLW